MCLSSFSTDTSPRSMNAPLSVYSLVMTPNPSHTILTIMSLNRFIVLTMPNFSKAIIHPALTLFHYLLLPHYQLIQPPPLLPFNLFHWILMMSQLPLTLPLTLRLPSPQTLTNHPVLCLIPVSLLHRLPHYPFVSLNGSRAVPLNIRLILNEPFMTHRKVW